MPVDGRIILKWIFQEMESGDMDWIDLAKYRNMWRDFVNAVMKVRLLSNVWNFLTSCGSIRWFEKDSAPWSLSMRCSHMYFRKWFWLDRKSANS
jgi:hypothetical protein